MHLQNIEHPTLPPTAIALAAQSSLQTTQIFCSGVPISADLILTAGHCIEQFQKSWPGDKLIVKFPDRPEDSFDANSWILHPQYQTSLHTGSLDADLAIVRLSRPINAAGVTTTKQETHADDGRLWMRGFSPARLQAGTIEAALKSKLSWNEMKLIRKLKPEGKIELKPRFARPASCPGDSGAPLWIVQNNELRLHGLIVQGNCEKGITRAVLLEEFSNWIERSAFTLTELHAGQRQLSSIYRFRLSEVFRMSL